MGERDRQEPMPTEVALSAADIDLIEVAKRTGGKVNFIADGQPSISWGENYSSLEWRKAYDGPVQIPGQKTLMLWRGEWGGTGMESAGLVMGQDFVAFVHPRDTSLFELSEGELGVEIISHGKIKSIKGPEGIFNPVFIEARNIADRNAEAVRASQQ